MRGTVGAAGDLSGAVDYTPYDVPDAPVNGFGFTGEPTDENGLLYLRARHYDPSIALFTAKDPFEGLASRPMSEHVPMTGRMTSAFFVSGGVGAMLLPWLVGIAFGWFGEVAIIWIIASGIVLITMLYWFAHRLGQQLIPSSNVKVVSHA